MSLSGRALASIGKALCSTWGLQKASKQVGRSTVRVSQEIASGLILNSRLNQYLGARHPGFWANVSVYTWGHVGGTENCSREKMCPNPSDLSSAWHSATCLRRVSLDLGRACNITVWSKRKMNLEVFWGKRSCLVRVGHSKT